MLRVLLRLLLLPFYRISVPGREHVPASGPVLLVANHVSYLDGLLVNFAVRRKVRFLVAERYFGRRGLRWVLRRLGAIPIRSDGGPKAIKAALDAARQALEAGEAVCIFAEGEITRTGHVLPFKRGVEKIAHGSGAPVVPVYIGGMWGSVFSYQSGALFNRFPRSIPYHACVAIGEPLPDTADTDTIRDAVNSLACTAWAERRHGMQPLDYSIVKGTRRRRFKLAFADPVRGSVPWFKVLTGAIALGRALRPTWQGQERVGLLLPPSIGGALANMAAVLSSRVIVNLNYTTGKGGMESACRQAELKTLVTSKTFLSKADLKPPENIELVYLEDIAATIGGRQRIAALLAALLAPLWLIRRMVDALPRHGIDDTSAIIFSSGSTGEPKGVELSHFNVLSNIEGVELMVKVGDHDRILHMLPFFHSFGNLLLWIGTHLGISLVFLPNPLDSEQVGEMVEGYGATILVATPTFLQMYMKKCSPGQFGSLRLVVAGAEKLPPPFSEAFREHFGIEIMEGYGATECAPVICVNSPDGRAPGVYQRGNKRGSVGRPLPGVMLKLLHPETQEELSDGGPGLLAVKGPNVMKGYIGREDLTQEAIRDGWYITGDIVEIDDEGFVTITDRLARFSKIGGEMVPHGRVEEALHQAAEATEQLFAVTAVRDSKKGERLVVVYVEIEHSPEHLCEYLRQSDLPNIFIPKQRDFVQVKELPVLGTGKMDLRAIRQIAEDNTA
jgi:acyl-[acyl-carrier-protein]-phospholipid O-acyltransferase / long-chain-fatty-acid--[acyl-carrier-protein] ligase